MRQGCSPQDGGGRGGYIAMHLFSKLVSLMDNDNEVKEKLKALFIERNEFSEVAAPCTLSDL
jgi:hypothetical protein